MPGPVVYSRPYYRSNPNWGPRHSNGRKQRDDISQKATYEDYMGVQMGDRIELRDWRTFDIDYWGNEPDA